MEVDFDVRKKELEEQMAAAAATAAWAAASEATVKAPVGPSAEKGKVADKTKGKGSSKA